MRRSGSRLLTSWVACASLAAGVAILGNARVAYAELELVLFDPRLQEDKSKFFLDFFGELQDDDQPPVPSPTIPFNLSYDWRLKGTPANPDPIISSFDRATLEGLAADKRFWTFNFGLSTGFQTDPNGVYEGVLNMELFLQGEHLNGPSPDDVDPNPLPLIRSKPVTVPVGELITAKGARNQVAHPHSSGRDGVDRYGFVTQFVVGFLQADGIPLQQVPTSPEATRNVVIAAQHFHPPPPSRPGEAPKRTGMTLGAGESFAFYDGDNDGLFVSTGFVDSAQLAPPTNGSGSAQIQALAVAAAAVDPPFVGDPVLDNTIFSLESSVGSGLIPYLGFDASRQLHVFGGGAISLPSFGAGDFSFEATFVELLYDPLTGDFFAPMDTVSYTDFPARAGYSGFLDQFTDAHLFDGDPSSRGMMLTFNIPGLAEATNGFADTFFPSEPAGFLLTGMFIPEPPTCVVLLLGMTAILCRREGAPWQFL